MMYKLIWLLLQTCFTIFQYLRLSFQQKVQKVSKSYDRRRDRSNHTEFLTEAENAYMGQCRAQLNKLPRHLSLIIGPDEQIQDELITRILRYALQIDIECISFYDTRLCENQRIQLHKLQQPKDVISKQLGERHLLWTTHSASGVAEIPNGKPYYPNCNGYTNTNGYKKNGQKNGFKDGKSIEIYEIVSSDGRALISKVCRELFIHRQNNEVQDLLKSRTLLAQRIDKELSLHLWNCTDPEVCIVFSKHMRTFGMMPWHTRFTEFFLHQQENLFDAKTFAEILFQYSRCEQRWGK